jgi:hypothetical protein
MYSYKGQHVRNRATKLKGEARRGNKEPSIADTAELHGQRARLHSTAPIGATIEPTEKSVWTVAPTNGRQYKAVVKENKPTKYKMTVRSRGSQPADEIKQLRKNKINLGEIKVGVNTLKSLHGEY